MILGIDRIERRAAVNLPATCNLFGDCGLIFSVEVFVHSVNGDVWEVEIRDLQSGVSIYSPPDKEWNLLVPETMAEAEPYLYLHLWTIGMID